MRSLGLVVMAMALVALAQWYEQRMLYVCCVVVSTDVDEDGQVIQAQALGLPPRNPEAIAAVQAVKRYKRLVLNQNNGSPLTNVKIEVDLWYRPWFNRWIAKARLDVLDPDGLRQIMSTASLFERTGYFFDCFKKNR